MQTWYYSSSGERQGPVSFDDLKALARSGRLNPVSDLAWTSGMADWLPSGRISGLFSDEPPASGSLFNPYAAPLTSSDNLLASLPAGTGPAEIAPGSVSLDSVGVAGRAFEITKRHFGSILAIGIVYVLTAAAAEFALELAGGFLFGPPPVPAHASMSAIIEASLTPGWLVQNLLSWVFSTYLGLGLTKAALNYASGHEASVATLFGQGGKLLRSLGASFLYSLMVAGGLLLLVVPGIYFALRFVLYQDAIVDRNMGIMESLRCSSRLTANNRLNLLLLFILMMLIIVAGAVALLVGLIFAIPMVTLCAALAYRVLQFGPVACQDLPGTTIPAIRASTRGDTPE